LIGEIYFPNIYLESSFVDFGCILNNTEVKQKVKMTNIGPLIVHYKWKFMLEKDNITPHFNVDLAELPVELLQSPLIVENNNPAETKDADDNIARQNSELIFNEASLAQIEPSTVLVDEEQPQASSDMQKPGEDEVSMPVLNIKNKLNELLMKKNSEFELPSIEEIFDISPLYGSLHPGETQDLTVTYFGHKEIRAYVKAICEIKNGPDYEMLIKGDASVLSYELSTKFVDFGCIVSVFCCFLLFGD
jgi:hydrocephalus-inducing protein